MGGSKLIGAIDIGTTKITVLVGEIVADRSLNIIGMGQAPSAGVKKGEILDFRAASKATQLAVTAAEESAGEQIESVYLAVSGSHLDGFFQLGTTNVNSADSIVRKTDIERAKTDGKNKELPRGRVYIHHIRNHFILDSRCVDNPLGMTGDRLEVGFWSVHADERTIRDQIHLVNGLGLRVEDVILSSLASASMVVSDEAKQHGVLVVDIGGGTTDWVLFRQGAVVKTGVIAVGGDHLCNDLALGLRVGGKHGKRLLREYGCCLTDTISSKEKVWMVGDQMIGDRRIPLVSIAKILEARLEELFNILRKQIALTNLKEAIPMGAVLCGGVSKLEGIEVLAERTLGANAYPGFHQRWVRDELRGTENSTALGLLSFALSNACEHGNHSTDNAGLLKRMARLFVG